MRALNLMKNFFHKLTIAYHAMNSTPKEIEEKAETIEVLPEAYEHEHAILESIVNNMPTAMIVTECNPELTITKINPSFLELFGYQSIDQVLGKPSSILRPPQIKGTKIIDQIYTTVSQGEVWDGRIVNIDSQGNNIPVHLHAAPIYSNNNEHPTAVVATMIDRRAIERDAALTLAGRLAAGFAHDINNALTSVLLGLNEYENSPQRGEEYLSIVQKGVQRAHTLASTILSLRPQKISPEETNLGNLIQNHFNERNYTQEYGSQNVSINYSTHSDYIVSVDHSLIHRAIENLIHNAAKSIIDSEQEGDIFIDIQDEEVRQNIVTHQGEKKYLQGTYVKLSVSDNGPGIPKHEMSKIWEYFYTKRTKREGSGLGMPIIELAISQHPGAYIAVESKVKEGTCFTVYFPATPAVTQHPSSKEESDFLAYQTDNK